MLSGMPIMQSVNQQFNTSFHYNSYNSHTSLINWMVHNIIFSFSYYQQFWSAKQTLQQFRPYTEMQIKKSEFNPISYTINPQIFQKYECIICMQKSISLFRCTTCKKPFCNQCSIDQKTKNNKCPQRCSPPPFALQLIPELSVQFRCPFSKQCPQILQNVKQFSQHNRTCSQISPHQKQQQNKKWQFECRNGHSLQIYLDVYDNLIKRQKCSECEDFNISRTLCRKCDERYCRYCRPLPIYDLKCPIGHQFVKRDVQSIFYRCDICELSPVILGVDIYDDFLCNFGICENCMKCLPEFKHPVEYHQNKHNYCKVVGVKPIGMVKLQQQQLHRLVILKAQQLKKCGWCAKQKMCYKKCMKCDEYYCIDCKYFEVLQGNQCQFGHSFNQIIIQPIEQIQEKHIDHPIPIPMQNQQKQQTHQNNKQNMMKQYMQQKKQEADKKIIHECYQCRNIMKDEIGDIFYADRECGVIYCHKCLNQLKLFNFDACQKYISMEMNICKFGNHPNFFLPLGKQLLGGCNACAQKRIIKIICGMCAQTQCYCCSCMPPRDIKLCYCGKKLKQKTGFIWKYCLMCYKQIDNEAYSCKPCGYNICEACYNRGPENQMSE